MLDRVYERLRGRRQDREDLVSRCPVPAQPTSQLVAQAGGTLGPGLKVKFERSRSQNSCHVADPDMDQGPYRHFTNP